jgi:transposase
MDVVHPRCAGMDISKRDAKVCVRVAGSGRRKTAETVTTWGSVTNQALALREHLIAEQVTLVVMEATGDYWKPFYYLLEDAGFEVMLVNARHAKNLPGRKTDVSDAAWLAQLGAHGLVRGSFVPPEPIRQFRISFVVTSSIEGRRRLVPIAAVPTRKVPHAAMRRWLSRPTRSGPGRLGRPHRRPLRPT